MEDIKRLHCRIQEEGYIPYKVRIHTLPEGVNENDVMEVIQRKYRMEPLKVELIPYRETNVKHKGLNFAAISCNSALYKELSYSKGVNIWWQWCRIDATPCAVKCT